MRYLIVIFFEAMMLLLLFGHWYDRTRPQPFYFTVIPNDSKEVHVSIRDGEFFVSFLRGKEEPYGTDTQRVIKTCLGGWEYGAMLNACGGMDRFEVDSACAAKVIYQILDGATCENGKLLMY